MRHKTHIAPAPQPPTNYTAKKKETLKNPEYARNLLKLQIERKEKWDIPCWLVFLLLGWDWLTSERIMPSQLLRPAHPKT